MSQSNNLSPFHLAISVHDLALCRKFYGKFLGLEEGRSVQNGLTLIFMVINW